MGRSRRRRSIWPILWICFLLAGFSPGLEIHFESRDSGFFIRPPNAGQKYPTSGLTPHSYGDEDRLSETEGVSGETVGSNGDGLSSSAGAIRTNHFTVLPSTQPVSIRVTYGPFSTKQTIPIRLLVPDPIDSDLTLTNGTSGTIVESEMIPPLDLSAHLVTPTVPKDTPILRVLFHAGQTTFGLPIPSNFPRTPQRQQQSSGRRHRTRLCLVAQATKHQNDIVTSSCSPDSHQATCLAELTLPIHWWPDGGILPTEIGDGPVKPTKIPIQVSYSVYEPENGHCNEIGISLTYGAGMPGEGSGTKRIQIQPLTPIATAILTDAQKSYRLIKADASDAVNLLVPQGPLYPHAKFYVPVTVGKHEHHSIVAFIMRARMKSGFRIIGIEPNIDKMWNITTDFDPRRTYATITAVRKMDPRLLSQQEVGKIEREEVFNWILEATEEIGEDWDGGRLVWVLRYAIQPSDDPSWMKTDPFANFGEARHKFMTRLEVQKDDIQAVLPIAKSWEVMNTAVLDGKQVSRPMKIFIVSRAGQVADVTLQASCRSSDESVLKVSSSCTSVYVDGSEIRGSTNASIVIKYGTFEGHASFTVWMPEFQLDVQLSDPKLNQIKGWRIPNGLLTSPPGKRGRNSFNTKDSGLASGATSTSTATSTPLMEDGLLENVRSGKIIKYKQVPISGDPRHQYLEQIHDGGDTDGDEGYDSGDGDMEVEDANEINEDLLMEDKYHCRLWYQHSRIDVYARFLASDHDSGRTSYFISKKTYLKVTDLISDYLRVVDTQVAIIKGTTPYIQGLSAGKTVVQVMSPVTSRVIGAKEIRVVNDKVSITSMKVDVISGVQLSLFPNTDSDNEFIAETTITSKLSAKFQYLLSNGNIAYSQVNMHLGYYQPFWHLSLHHTMALTILCTQEALLDIQLRFSDNSWTALGEIERENYVLTVDSLQPRVVELPPIQNSKHPRILAISEGGGPIMRVSLELSDQCHRPNSQPLAMSVAHVEVNFSTSPSRSEFTQNDSTQGFGSSKQSFRKGGRSGSKDRTQSSSDLKKDPSLLLLSNNDITGIPLRDDSSRAARPSSQNIETLTVGYNGEKGWSLVPRSTPQEIAVYVLLGVFSVAILVFVASCVVYASRVKKREISHPGETDIKFEVTPGGGIGSRTMTLRGGGYPATTNVHDWVWLGRTSLALHPSLDSSKQSSRILNYESGSGNLAHHLTTNGNVRIIANPNFDSPHSAHHQQQDHTIFQSTSDGGQLMGLSSPLSRPSLSRHQELQPLLCTINGNSPPISPPKLQHKPSPLVSPSPFIDTTTYSKGRVIQSSPQRPLPSSPLDYRPPVPPHRNLKSTSSSGQISVSSPTAVPPPVPTSSPPRSTTNSTKSNSSVNHYGHLHHHHHHSNRRDTETPSSVNDFEFDDLNRHRSTAATVGELIDTKEVNVLRNPMCYIDEEDEEGDYREDSRLAEPKLTMAAGAAAKRNHRVKNYQYIDNIKLNIDYDQLMEYFDSLKETEA